MENRFRARYFSWSSWSSIRMLKLHFWEAQQREAIAFDNF